MRLAVRGETDIRQPKVGVAAILYHAYGDKILISERRSGKCQGMYSAPGGHLEWMETIEDGVLRELYEETGITAKPEDCSILGVDQGFAPEEDHHWIIIFVRVLAWEGEPKDTEPDKHGPWRWCSMRDLPDNTLDTLKRLVIR